MKQQRKQPSAAPHQGKGKVEALLTVADDIQLMQLGRIMAIGLYPDRVIVMHRPADAPADAVPALGRLALLLTVKGLPPGEHEVATTIVFPKGTGEMKSQGARVQVDDAGGAINLQMAFSSFPVSAEGEFTLRVELAGCTIEEHFWILHRDLTAALEHLANRPPIRAPQPPAVEDARKPDQKRRRAAQAHPPVAPTKVAAKKRRTPSPN